MCQEPLSNLTGRFLQCLVDVGSAVLFNILRDYPAPTLNESLDLLNADMKASDCIAPAGVSIEAGYHQHYWTGTEPYCALTYVTSMTRGQVMTLHMQV